MEYYNIITKINNFNLGFTMNDFNSLSSIIKEARSIYNQDVLDGKLDAKVHYDAVMDHLYTVVFSVLKGKLHFEDEVINKIMHLIDYADVMEDVFILDGNVFTKVHDNKNNDISFIPLDNFCDITTDKFGKNVLNNNFKYFFIESLNNSIGTWFSDQLDKKKMLSMNNNNITYNLLDMNIFINSSLKSIIDSAANHLQQVTRLVLRFNDDLYSFDVKIHDEYLILSYNDYPVSRLSKILVEKEKNKKL